jgi:vacuolar protein 8
MILAETREKLSQTEPELVQLLVQSMENSGAKVQRQAALALRNLANDGKLCRLLSLRALNIS